MDHELDYELIDFGAGRKLERFGEVVVDRPDLAANAAAHSQQMSWAGMHARFELLGEKNMQTRGRWHISNALPNPWICVSGSVHFELKPTDFGHVGMFPEQAPCWHWIRQQIDTCYDRRSQSEPVQMLNLFAHTGGSTLAAASAGASVVHVDSARNVVAWARRNAEHSNLEKAPVRWIVEDALKYVNRELKRGKRYEGVIVDPPAYGHGAAGETWQIDKHLPDLLSSCAQLLAAQARFVLLTCHAPQYDAKHLTKMIVDAGIASSAKQVESGGLSLKTSDGRQLPAGTFARLAIE
jgi:23S rRNA (cytosine1962-C5)-methyltransferase